MTMTPKMPPAPPDTPTPTFKPGDRVRCGWTGHEGVIVEDAARPPASPNRAPNCLVEWSVPAGMAGARSIVEASDLALLDGEPQAEPAPPHVPVTVELVAPFASELSGPPLDHDPAVLSALEGENRMLRTFLVKLYPVVGAAWATLPSVGGTGEQELEYLLATWPGIGLPPEARLARGVDRKSVEEVEKKTIPSRDLQTGLPPSAEGQAVDVTAAAPLASPSPFYLWELEHKERLRQKGEAVLGLDEHGTVTDAFVKQAVVVPPLWPLPIAEPTDREAMALAFWGAKQTAPTDREPSRAELAANLKTAIRRWTTEGKDDGPNGPLENAWGAMLDALEKSVPPPEVSAAVVAYNEALIADAALLRDAAEAFFGEDLETPRPGDDGFTPPAPGWVEIPLRLRVDTLAKLNSFCASTEGEMSRDKLLRVLVETGIVHWEAEEAAARAAADVPEMCAWCRTRGTTGVSEGGMPYCYDCAKTCKVCEDQPRGPDEEACSGCRAAAGEKAVLQ